MNEFPFENKYYELIARHEILLQKQKDGELDKDEWDELIEDLEAHKMFALANDMRRDMREEIEE